MQTRYFFLFFLILITALFNGPVVKSAEVAVPRVIRISGELPTPNGVEKVFGVTFALYKEEAGGSPVWLETQNVTVNSSGHYSVLLGTRSSEGLPADLFSSGESRWLGVRVEGGEELPRLQLVSVPYALKAQDAETLGGHPASAYVLSDLTSSNASTPGARKTSSQVSATDMQAQSVDGTGTANYIAKFSGGSTVGNSSLYEDPLSLKVGFGTTNPAEKLEVNGNLLLRGQAYHQVQVIGAQSGGRLGQDNQGFFFASDTGGKGFRFFTTPSGGSLTQQMTIGSTGFIGFGTANPAERAEVNGNLLLRGQQFHQIQVIGGQSAGRLGQDNQGFFFASDTQNKPFRLFTTPQGGSLTPQMTILPHGFTGFGSAAPAERVEVNGNLLLRGQQFHQVQVIGGQSAGRLGQDNQGFFFASDTAGKPFRIFTTPQGGSLSQQFTLTSEGNLGIGVATPNSRLSVAGVIESTSGGIKFPDGSTLLSAANQTAPTVFVASTTDQVVKVIQSQTGASEFVASGIPSALRGDAATTSGNAAGVFGTSSSYAGYGVVGVNTSSCDPARISDCNAMGVFGVSAAASHGTGVWGQAEGTTGDNVGVYGSARGTQATGVWGHTSNTSGDGIGVIGSTEAIYGTGIFAESSHPSGSTAAIFGRNHSTNGIGLQLEASSASTSNLIVARSGSYPNYSDVFRVDATGRVFANGNLQASGADFAESVTVLGERQQYEPGDVLAIDPTGTRRFTLVSEPYSTLVAGIFSTRPGLLATPHADGDPRLADEVPLAVVGIVPCKVTDENGPIHPGDLLVSSSRPGYAMKGTDRQRMMGAVIGKALGTLASGEGVVEVLVSLQ